MLTPGLLLCAMSWGAGAGAQDGTVHPITSLPRAKGATDVAPPVMEAPVVVAPVVVAPAATVAPVPMAAPSATSTPAAPAVYPAAPAGTQAPAVVAPAATGSAIGTPGVEAYPPPPGRPAATVTEKAAEPVTETATEPDRGSRKSASLFREAQKRKAKAEKPPYSVGPFSTLAMGVKVGFAGAGVEFATPLAQRLNLRAGASFFQFSGDFDEDGTSIHGEAKFRSGTASLDIFPFNNGFRISPGVTWYNGNNMNMTANVPAGGEFELGDANLYSSPTDPIHGTASMTFGNRIAPSITIGFGNMIPRSGKHISFPFEIGFQYLGKQPEVNLYLGGSACLENPNAPGFTAVSCGSVSTFAGDLQQENDEVNSDIQGLRFYPIISQGFAVRF